jgi:hypothetical protein
LLLFLFEGDDPEAPLPPLAESSGEPFGIENGARLLDADESSRMPLLDDGDDENSRKSNRRCRCHCVVDAVPAILVADDAGGCDDSADEAAGDCREKAAAVLLAPGRKVLQLLFLPLPT